MHFYFIECPTISSQPALDDIKFYKCESCLFGSTDEMDIESHECKVTQINVDININGLYIHNMIYTTTSNDSCDRLNSNQLYQFFSFPSAFHRHTTHPSNHLHLCSLNQHQLATVWSHFTFHPFGEGFWMSEMAKASGTSSHLFLILAVAARSAPPSPSICLPDNNGSLHIPMSLHPPLGPQLNLIFGLSLTPETVSYQQQSQCRMLCE